MRTLERSVLLLLFIALSLTVPSVHAQSTSIAELRYPSRMSAGSLDPISVTATVSYRDSPAGYLLVIGIVDMGLKPAKVVVGMPTSSPDHCAYQPVIAPYCSITTSSSSGTERLEFKIGGIFGGPMAVGNWNLNMTAVLLTPNGTAVENSQSSVLFTIVVSPMILTVKVPANVTVTVDGVKQPPGPIQVPVISGPHNIFVPNTVQLDNIRLRFDGWSDGYTAPNRTVKINLSQSYEAVYVTQYRLTIVGQAASATGQDWYDAGTIATFSVEDTEQMNGILGSLGGKLRFQGWYENNAFLTNSSTDTIIMDKPHTITVSWKADYTLPIIISAATFIALVFVSFAIYRRTTAKTLRTRSQRSATGRHSARRSGADRKK